MARKAPAKKKKKAKRGTKLAAHIFLDCGNPKKGCKIVRRPAGSKTATYPGFRYTTQAKPCGSSRKTCPVQLFYKAGQPHLRFCLKKNKPGKTLAVKTPQEAQRLASAACRCWTRSHSDPKKRSFDKCRGLKNAGLGKPKKRSR